MPTLLHSNYLLVLLPQGPGEPNERSRYLHGLEPAGETACRRKSWNGLGSNFYNERSYTVAEKYLTALSQSDNLTAVKPDFWFYLGDSETRA